MKPIVTLLFTILGTAAVTLLPGCGDGGDEVRVYQISHPEDFDPHAGHDHAKPAPDMAAPMSPTPTGGQPSVNPSSSMQSLPGMESAAAAIDTPDWSVPESWEELAPTSIRKGNFRIVQGEQTAEITVTAFPGDVGGLEANVNRWRRQIGLPSEPLATLQQSIEPIEIDGQPAFYIDLLNPQATEGIGILGAVIPHGTKTWFVKMVGNQSVLEDQQDNLMLFLRSIQF
jgi:hypothetical protein